MFGVFYPVMLLFLCFAILRRIWVLLVNVNHKLKILNLNFDSPNPESTFISICYGVGMHEVFEYRINT